MNESAPLYQPKPLPIRERPVWFRAQTFLIGLVLGLATLSGLGYWMGRHNSHPGYTRIIPAISPETFYYPTVAELCSIVRARCKPGQVLVLVGGNSILYGSGQPFDELWSRHLQKLLGDRYCVINLAFRGGSVSDGAAVVAEVLRKQFPHQILIANTGTIQGIGPVGSDPFRFLFWEAYYKGELENYAPRKTYVGYYYRDHKDTLGDRLETAGRVWLDRALHFRDFWNWVAMRWFFTVPNKYYPTWTEQFQARDLFKDEEPDFNETPFEQRFPPSSVGIETRIIRGGTAPYYRRTAAGGWVLEASARSGIEQDIQASMPAPLRRRTLIIISKNSPFYVRRLPPDEQKRDAQSFGDTIALYRAAGYQAMTYPDTINEYDYGDRAHLTTSGGRKLADAVAPEVRAMAKELGYLSPVHP